MSEYRYWYREGTALRDEIEHASPADDELFVWYIGQCGFVFKRNHTIIYIDPVLNDITGDDGTTRKFYPEPFSPELVHADYVICTHAHADHMAIPTLKAIAKGDPHTVFIVPEDCISHMTGNSEAGIDPARILEARSGEALTLADTGITLHPVSAAHPVHMKSENGGDIALSYMINFAGIRILHTGDTYLTKSLYDNLTAMPAPHLFLPPINGGDYFRTTRNCIGNLSAIEAARLAVELHADLTIPTHYDMIFDNTVDPLDFVRELRRLAASRKIACKWKLPELGEMVIIR